MKILKSILSNKFVTTEQYNELNNDVIKFIHKYYEKKIQYTNLNHSDEILPSSDAFKEITLAINACNDLDKYITHYNEMERRMKQIIPHDINYNFLSVGKSGKDFYIDKDDNEWGQKYYHKIEVDNYFENNENLWKTLYDILYSEALKKCFLLL